MNTVEGHKVPATPQPSTAGGSLSVQVVRAARFEISLRNFIRAKGEAWDHNSARSWAADFMADMKHWCDRHQLSFSEIEQLASSHHRSELDFDQDMLQVGVIRSLPPISPH